MKFNSPLGDALSSTLALLLTGLASSKVGRLRRRPWVHERAICETLATASMHTFVARNTSIDLAHLQ